jgi:hypothetical protein
MEFFIRVGSILLTYYDYKVKKREKDHYGTSLFKT